MPRLSVKVKILITVLIPYVRLVPIAITIPSLYVILRVAVICSTLIQIIYFVA